MYDENRFSELMLRVNSLERRLLIMQSRRKKLSSTDCSVMMGGIKDDLAFISMICGYSSDYVPQDGSFSQFQKNPSLEAELESSGAAGSNGTEFNSEEKAMEVSAKLASEASLSSESLEAKSSVADDSKKPVRRRKPGSGRRKQKKALERIDDVPNIDVDVKEEPVLEPV